MSQEYFLFYAVANIVCSVMLAILLISDQLHSTRQEKQIWFNRTIIAHILYFISDIGWAAVLSGNLPRTRFLVVFFNLLNYVVLSLMAYEWFMYMAASEDMDFRKNRKKRNLCLIPLILSVTVLMAAYIADPYSWVNESGEVSEWYFPMMVAAPSVYLLSACILSLINARKVRSRDRKRMFLLIGVYPLVVLGFGLIQTYMLNAPLFCLGVSVMLMVFYIANLQMLVSVDSLTRLNNRGQIDRYMEQARYREGTETYAMMIDIDRFKEINDTYGHAEGDRALLLMAESLKMTAVRMKAPVFIGRYGGDEFTVFIQSAEVQDLPERMTEEIRAALREKRAENGLLYELNVSMGYDVLKEKDDTLEACLARADRKLYENKRAKNLNR